MISKEALEQTHLISWTRFIRGKHPEVDLLYHIPNGGSRNKLEAYHLKEQGVKAGVPDLCLPVARGGYHGLYIEMKVKGNKPTENQKEWISRLNEQGYRAVVCYGYEEAAKEIQQYLNSTHVDK